MSASGKASRGSELLKNTGIIGFGTMCTKALSFLLLPLYTSLLSTSDYGVFDLVTTLSSLLVTVGNCQLSQAIFRFATENRGDRGSVASVLTVVYAMSAALAAAYAVLAAVALRFVTMDYAWVLLPSVLLNIALQVLLYTARGLGDNVAYALAGFASASATVALNVVLLAVFDMGLGGMFASYLVGPCVGCAVVLVRDRPWRYVRPSLWDAALAKKMVRYSLPLVPNELSWWVLHSADRVVVTAALGAAANGLLSVANKFSAIYSTVFSVFNSAWTEQVVLHYRDPDGKDFVRDTSNVAVRFFSGVLLVAMSLIPFVWPVMVDQSYDGAYTLCPLYMVAAFANLFTGLVSPIYLVNNESGKVMQATLVAAVVNVGLLLVLIPPMGPYAAPVSTIAGYGLTAVMRVADVERRHMHLGLDPRVICATLVLAALSTWSYFDGRFAAQLAVLVSCLAYSVAINLRFVRKAVAMLRR